MVLPAAPFQAGARPLTAAEAGESLQAAPTSCNIEGLGGAVFIGKPVEATRTRLAIGGWLLPERSRKPANKAAVRFIDSSSGAAWQQSITHWIPRPDVLAVTRAKELGDVGFQGVFYANVLKPGTYRVAIVFDDAGIPSICDNGKLVIIR